MSDFLNACRSLWFLLSTLAFILLGSKLRERLAQVVPFCGLVHLVLLERVDPGLLVVLALRKLVVPIVLRVAAALARLVRVLAAAETELLLEPLGLFLGELLWLAQVVDVHGVRVLAGRWARGGRRLEFVASHVHLNGECPVEVLVPRQRNAVRVDLTRGSHDGLDLNIA